MTNYDHDSTNKFLARGYKSPDSGSYHPYAVMDDGGTLCEHCVNRADTPVYSVHNVDEDGPGTDGWCIMGWGHSGDGDEFLACDHCGRVIIEEDES